MVKINFTEVIPEPTKMTLNLKPPSPEEFEELKVRMEGWLSRYKGGVYMDTQWCPRCQKNTEHEVQESKLVRVVTCTKCRLVASREWKVTTIKEDKT